MVAAVKDAAKDWDYDRVSKSNSSQGHGEEIQKAKRSIVMSTGAKPGLNLLAVEKLTSHKNPGRDALRTTKNVPVGNLQPGSAPSAPTG